ncbi:sulfur oxidation c-type cytochrome SoxX [Cohaesibacter celericrescens]|jgi:sulfur-oxidizing protein SoxX|uniref:Sulfur oxidation c-type cytochrome SoxX n=1 Tax=Cohaesibacter celericrescens TaxID=2067669 RepID=A0A2N5XTK5_9HYPH|nr:sulfur oxidation c-type cytochrome SoxX [Cohaesibacter celericrescens]PLW77833.1 sulfur oxidation c-type cytochrome SoxX [Cohaesibacter celericrescens]
MKHIAWAAFALILGSSAAMADVVKPGDVTFDEGAVPAPLTGQAGVAEEGRKTFISRKLGNCLACHENSEMKLEQFHGEVGPSLDGVADRWNEAELRGIIINSKNTYEGTIMPGFYVGEDFPRTAKQFKGKTILTAQQVEDVVAYLKTLKEQ